MNQIKWIQFIHTYISLFVPLQGDYIGLNNSDLFLIKHRIFGRTDKDIISCTIIGEVIKGK